MKPYTGNANLMLGPELFGYVNVGHFVYGNKGGQFLLWGAWVWQEPYTSSGERRLPVWSDHHDNIVVACPRDLSIFLVKESDDTSELFMWVHTVSRDPEHWRHDRHPRDRGTEYVPSYFAWELINL